jgi:hypothetical protein
VIDKQRLKYIRRAQKRKAGRDDPVAKPAVPIEKLRFDPPMSDVERALIAAEIRSRDPQWGRPVTTALDGPTE